MFKSTWTPPNHTSQEFQAMHLHNIISVALNTRQYVIMCVFPRSQSKWPPCYVRFPFSRLCSFKILRSTLSERGRAAVLFVGNLLTSNLLHIIREKSLQLPSNNRYDQMCVLMNILDSIGWSPICWESGGLRPWFFTIIVYSGHGHLKNWHWHWQRTWQRHWA